MTECDTQRFYDAWGSLTEKLCVLLNQKRCRIPLIISVLFSFIPNLYWARSESVSYLFSWFFFHILIKRWQILVRQSITSLVWVQIRMIHIWIVSEGVNVNASHIQNKWKYFNFNHHILSTVVLCLRFWYFIIIYNIWNFFVGFNTQFYIQIRVASRELL